MQSSLVVMVAAESVVHVRTSNLDEIEATLLAAFGDVHLRSQDPAAVDLVLRAATGSRVQIVDFDLRARGSARLDQHEVGATTYLAGVALGGRYSLSTRHGDLDLTRPYLYPEVTDADLDHQRLRTIAIDRALLHERARAISGRDEIALRFHRLSPVDDVLGQVWVDLLQYAATVIGDASSRPAGGDPLTVLLADTLLRTFPNTATDVRPERRRPAPVRVRRALAYMEEHVRSPITLPDIAAAAGFSVRGLQNAFRNDLDTTPRAHLTELRLEGVRAALLSADPVVDSVAAIAGSWGFMHSGRFAAAYRARFGERPNDTLRH